MIIASATDFRAAPQAELPPFLFHYLDGGAGAEVTMNRNMADLQTIDLRQKTLRGSEDLDLSTEWFGTRFELPLALASVGLTGMYARRGEVQVAQAAAMAST
ncbi:hypothetical protein ABENE_21935 [Asticcacaulis benevestitus DSM 16100 = ATCC BAA-896]|uniref:FMN hydroxy acid dehydrogenase domain-containing protein n=1 Tax=Asticcacaulis benevestitus DSM 16100 = ATCC BAA-896 TaxID=1121022 RepID=V4NI39_9CAUL|nr:hypothetical protein ABENE_21935 [Asticcacaulis benevestitus DSM 16100 = ATCC BAA-896]